MSSPESSPPKSWQEVMTPAAWISAGKWGMIIGVVYYLIGIGINILGGLALSSGPDATKNPVVLLPICGGLFVLFLCIYGAGFMPAAEQQHIAPGIIGTLVMLLILRGLQFLYTPVLPGTANQTATSLPIQIVSALLALAAYLGIGWLGAFYGVKRSIRKTSA